MCKISFARSCECVFTRRYSGPRTLGARKLRRSGRGEINKVPMRIRRASSSAQAAVLARRLAQIGGRHTQKYRRRRCRANYAARSRAPIILPSCAMPPISSSARRPFVNTRCSIIDVQVCCVSFMTTRANRTAGPRRCLAGAILLTAGASSNARQIAAMAMCIARDTC